MHPKELRKVKNGTGHLTHLSLPNSQLYIGIDFHQDSRINALTADPDKRCYLLYPGEESLDISVNSLGEEGKETVVFVLDATWACSKKMLRLSRNLQKLPRITFPFETPSDFEIKEQPCEQCLSTIESVARVLGHLAVQGEEAVSQEALEAFLHPFRTMNAYQKPFMEQNDASRYRRR